MTLEQRLRANVAKASADVAQVESRLALAQEGVIEATAADIERTAREALPLRQGLLRQAERDLAEYLTKRASR